MLRGDQLIRETLGATRTTNGKVMKVSQETLEEMKTVQKQLEDQKRALAQFRATIKWNLFAKLYLVVADFFQRAKIYLTSYALNIHLAEIEKMQKMDNYTTALMSPHLKPQILNDDWETITVKIGETEFKWKDAILLPNDAEGKQRAVEWDWTLANVHHKPGISTQAVEKYILEAMGGEIPQVVILSTGRGHGGKRDNSGAGELQIQPNVEKYLKEQGVKEVHILKTAAACDKYNELAKQGIKVAALIHTTC